MADKYTKNNKNIEKKPFYANIDKKDYLFIKDYVKYIDGNEFSNDMAIKLLVMVFSRCSIQLIDECRLELGMIKKLPEQSNSHLPKDL